MNIWVILLVCLAVAGVVWAYPRLPSPWNIFLVIVVAIASILVLLSLSGVVPGGVSLTT